MASEKNDIEDPIGDCCTQAAMEYVLPEFFENIPLNSRAAGFERNIDDKLGLLDVLFLQSKDMRMYGSVAEFHQDLKVYMGFTGYQEKFRYHLAEPPIVSSFEPYKTLKGKSYLFTKDIFHHMQRILFMNNRSSHFCERSKFVAAAMLFALRKKQAEMANELELVECSFEKIERFMRKEVMEKRNLTSLSIHLENIHEYYDLNEEEVNTLKRLYMEDSKRPDKKDLIIIRDICYEWLENLFLALKNKREWLEPKTGPNFVPPVRLFNDNGRKFVMITEWVEQMKRAGIDLEIMKLPETFFSSDEIATIDWKDIFDLVGNDIMNKIEFVVTPIRRAKHAAVPIPTRYKSFCIPGSDALMQLLKKLIHGKKLFQRTDQESWGKVESFLNKVTSYFNGENVSYFFVDLKVFDQINAECDEEFLKLDLPSATTCIEDVEAGNFPLKEELKNLNLVRAFPNILNYALRAYEKVLACTYRGFQSTSDMYDVVEYCQMACIFERFPKLKEFLHSQRSCYRIINSNCSECDTPCSMKFTKWELIDRDFEIRELPGGAVSGSNFRAYPLCIVGKKYEVYPSKSLLRDMNYLNNVLSEEARAKHKQVVSKSKDIEHIFFVLIDESDRKWYHEVILKELVDRKETISYSDCMDRVIARGRENFFLRTMWKYDGHKRECVGVFKDEAFPLLSLILKQQKLFTSENRRKMEKLLSKIDADPYYGIVVPTLSLHELKELLEMFNINKEILVLVPDYHLGTPSSYIVSYDTSFGNAYEMPEAVWYLFQLLGIFCDWEEVLAKNSPKFRSVKTVYNKIFQSILGWFGNKNSYITVTSVHGLMEDLKVTCEINKVPTFPDWEIKKDHPEDLLGFRVFLNHPVVKLGNQFSDRDIEKLRNVKVKRWRIYVAMMFLIIETRLNNDYPELKKHLLSYLRADNSQYLAPGSNIADTVVRGRAVFKDDDGEEEFIRAKNENRLKATVENVFRVALKHFRKDKTPIEETNDIANKKSTLTLDAQKPSSGGPSEEVNIEQPETINTDQNSSEISKEPKKKETPEESLPNVPMVETSTSSKPKNDKQGKSKREQKPVDRNQDGETKEVVRVGKCSKCYNTHLECTKVKESFNSEKKKCTSLEKKLEAAQKELNIFKKREAEIEEMMKKKYEDQLNDVNQKLKECTEEKETANTKIAELEETLKWRGVEMNRRVDEVTWNKKRELEEKDEFAKSLQETIKKLNDQATSRDIFTKALQENIRELTQQLKSKDLILQTIPDQIPSSSSSYQDPTQPSTSSSTPSDSSPCQERSPEEVIRDVLQRLIDDREKVQKERTMKHERVDKLLRHFSEKETRNWIDYQSRKFNVEYENYLKALNDKISMIENVDELPPLPLAPGLCEKIMKMYNDIVKKESELKARNYTRTKPTPFSRPPEELDDQECLICLGDMEEHEQTLKCTSCSRRFHKNCLEDWLKKKRLCPACDVGMLPPGEFPAFQLA